MSSKQHGEQCRTSGGRVPGLFDSRSVYRERGGDGSITGRGEVKLHCKSDSQSEQCYILMQMKENKVAYICSAYAMRRSDKRPDRVEISPEQLSAAAIEAEVSARLNFPLLK